MFAKLLVKLFGISENAAAYFGMAALAMTFAAGFLLGLVVG